MSGYRTLAIALLLAGAAAQPINAEENMIFSGTLIAPPACTISDKGGRIEVLFKRNISINKIDGSNYRQAVPYQIECPGDSNLAAAFRMRMTLIGVHTQFDNTAVQTSIPDLGIKLLLGGTAFTLNQPLQFEVAAGSTPPVLEAVPVKKTGASLSSMAFTASALLIAELY